MEDFFYWIQAEGEGHYYFLFFPVALLTLFFLLKDRRIKFVIPTAVMTIIIVNPFFYYIWDKLRLYVYWRILWVIPILPVCAAVPAILSEKIHRKWGKAGICIVFFILFGTMGSYIYKGREGNFRIPADNPDKLPESVIEVADYLLSIDDHPRVIADPNISVYIRQYTGKIDTLFGRDIFGYILGPNKQAKEVYAAINELQGDISTVASFMRNDGYKYLIIRTKGREKQLEENGFLKKRSILGYDIYTVDGTPSIYKKWDDLGRVIEIKEIDENGNPINGKDGYATIQYQYDKYNHIIFEFHTDVDGNGVLDASGKAGFEREYDNKNHLIVERYLGADKNLVANLQNYAEIKKRYKFGNLIEEAYFDENGFPVKRLDLAYAKRKLQWDKNKNLITEEYYDINGERTLCSNGYAIIRREYIENRMIGEAYFDKDNNPTIIYDGYSSYKKKYDDNGNVIAISYYGLDGEAVENINGYAKEERQYDINGNMIVQRFFDAQNNLVLAPCGYAEVFKEYDDKGRVIKESYFGENNPYEQRGGYASIEQEYDSEGNLSLRRYLGVNGEPACRLDGYAKVKWDNTGTIRNIKLLDNEENEISLLGINLVQDVNTGKDGFSEWLVPKRNVENSCFNIGTANLGEKKVGDSYSCQLEIEFSNVVATEGKQFKFWAQGSVDGLWGIENVWNARLVYLDKAPIDGIYQYKYTMQLTDEMVNAGTFNIGFRCDYWKNGAFRVKNVKIEKGNMISTWSPGL